jgi:hypothetical protein
MEVVMTMAVVVTMTMAMPSTSVDDEGALCISLWETPSGKQWYKCPICLYKEFEYSNKVLLHVWPVIKSQSIENRNVCST